MTITETRHLIAQAARELHMTIEPYSRALSIVTDVETPGTYAVTFVNRRGDPAAVSIPMDASYRSILGMLGAAWKGQDKSPDGDNKSVG